MRSGKVSVGVSESSSELSAKPITARAKRSLAMARRGSEPHVREYTSTSYDTASEGVASQSLSVSGTGCKLKRIARKELEKLRGLVDRQRNSYLRQLQREVERLNRLQELFLLAEDNRPTSSQMSTAASDSAEVSVLERISTSNDSSSVGAQTSSSQLGSEQESAAKERYFVSVGMTTAKKKQRGGTLTVSRRTSRQQRRPRELRGLCPSRLSNDAKSPPSEAPAKSNHVQANEDLSLQAAFAAHCGHLTPAFSGTAVAGSNTC
uniref:Uncharacterized protein n=1 Tax=Ixodes ricinus TaxID=34613 RepID=A0A090XBK6_IXORI